MKEEKEKLMNELKEKLNHLGPEDISKRKLELLLELLNSEADEENEKKLHRIMSFDEVSEYIYSKLLEGKGELQEDLVFYSDFLEEDNDESTVGNGIGVRTISVFDEFYQRMLVLGVYGEDFTGILSYCKDEIKKDEVILFVKSWLCMMRHQFGNDHLILKEK